MIDFVLYAIGKRYKLVSQSYEDRYLLNPMAAFIWTFCDGKTEVQAIRAVLEVVFVNNKAEVAKDLFY